KARNPSSNGVMFLPCNSAEAMADHLDHLQHPLRVISRSNLRHQLKVVRHRLHRTAPVKHALWKVGRLLNHLRGKALSFPYFDLRHSKAPCRGAAGLGYLVLVGRADLTNWITHQMAKAMVSISHATVPRNAPAWAIPPPRASSAGT